MEDILWERFGRVSISLFPFIPIIYLNILVSPQPETLKQIKEGSRLHPSDDMIVEPCILELEAASIASSYRGISSGGIAAGSCATKLQ